MNKKEIKVGDFVEFYGHSVSCEAERKRYEKGLCPAENDKRHLKVGNIYEVVDFKRYDYGEFMDIRGVGVNGDKIVVSGVSALNFIKINNKIMKITNLVKKILDGDTRKLVKAEFINGDLALTDEGVAELLGILFLEKKEELVKIAEEKLSEENAK